MNQNEINALNDVIESECFDMLDEFTAEEIKDIITKIIETYRKTNKETIDIEYKNYVIRIKNSLTNSFVSMSGLNDNANTGLSENAVYYIVKNKEMDYYDLSELTNLVNQAWYNAQNEKD